MLAWRANNILATKLAFGLISRKLITLMIKALITLKFSSLPMLIDTSHIKTMSTFNSQAVKRAMKCLQMLLYVKIQYEHISITLIS